MVWVWAAILLTALAVRELAVPSWLVRRSLQQFNAGDRVGARSTLQRALRTPLLLSHRGKVDLRYQLAWYYMAAKEYAAAIAELETALKELGGGVSRTFWSWLEARLRRRLAECLEGVGREAEAHEQRGQVFELLGKGEKDAGWYTLRGQMLADRNQHAEACSAFEEALRLFPTATGVGASRGEILVRLALSSYNAGRPQQAVRYAEEAIAVPVTGVHLSSAHSTAGIGYSTLRELEKAEAHYLAAAQVAQADRRTPSAARYLAMQATVLRKRGELTAALAVCDEAEAIHSEAARTAWGVRQDCYRGRGQWQEARDALQRYRESAAFPSPAAERRTRSVAELGLAWIEIEAERPEFAAHHLQSAATELKHDAKLACWCASSLPVVLAQLGRAEEARAALARARSEARQFQEDQETYSNFLTGAGTAHYYLGEDRAAIEVWDEFLKLHQVPAALPKALYYSGLSQLRLGATERARNLLQRADEMSDENYYSSLSRQELAAFPTL